MATPVVTLIPDRDSYLPGEPVVVQVVAVDPDNSAETLVLDGTDSTGNPVHVTLAITRRDTFTITSAKWERTGVALTVAGMTLSGTMPSA